MLNKRLDLVKSIAALEVTVHLAAAGQSLSALHDLFHAEPSVDLDQLLHLGRLAQVMGVQQLRGHSFPRISHGALLSSMADFVG